MLYIVSFILIFQIQHLTFIDSILIMTLLAVSNVLIIGTRKCEQILHIDIQINCNPDNFEVVISFLVFESRSDEQA